MFEVFGLRNAVVGLAAVMATTLLAPAIAAGCGSATPCMVDGGEYRIALPPKTAEGQKTGAIVYFHGYRGSAEGVMANKGLMQVAKDLSVALISPHGDGRTWSFPGSPSQRRDEFAFVEAVMADALARFPIDPDRVMASGFSMGGSMVWFLACQAPARFAGYAPIAGAFWEPLPEACELAPPALAHLFHVHGRTDTVVPLAGRPIANGRAHQGDTFKSIDVWLRPLGADIAKSSYPDGKLDCAFWTPAGDGGIELCLHGGGHSMRPAWVARAWGKLAAAKGWKG